MILTVVIICWSILFWKKVHITTIGTLEKAAILTTSGLQLVLKNHHMIAKQDCDIAVNSDTY